MHTDEFWTCSKFISGHVQANSRPDLSGRNESEIGVNAVKCKQVGKINNITLSHACSRVTIPFLDGNGYWSWTQDVWCMIMVWNLLCYFQNILGEFCALMMFVCPRCRYLMSWWYVLRMRARVCDVCLSLVPVSDVLMVGSAHECECVWCLRRSIIGWQANNPTSVASRPVSILAADAAGSDADPQDKAWFISWDWWQLISVPHWCYIKGAAATAAALCVQTMIATCQQIH